MIANPKQTAAAAALEEKQMSKLLLSADQVRDAWSHVMRIDRLMKIEVEDDVYELYDIVVPVPAALIQERIDAALNEALERLYALGITLTEREISHPHRLRGGS